LWRVIHESGYAAGSDERTAVNTPRNAVGFPLKIYKDWQKKLAVIFYTGNPIRRELYFKAHLVEGLVKFKLTADYQLLLVFCVVERKPQSRRH